MSTVTPLTRDEARLDWPDATRGLGVVAVVLFHVLIWNHAQIGDGNTALAGVWGQTNVAVGRLRMPVLFALSGIFASRGILAGWRVGSIKLRAASNFYLYALWLTIYLGFFLAVQRPDFPHTFTTPRAWLEQFLIPDTTLWFILALAVYPLILGGLRALRIPTVTVLTIAMVLWISGTYLDMPGFTDKVAANLLFFSVGVYFSEQLKKVSRISVRLKLLCVAAFFSLVLLASLVPQAFVKPVVLLSSLVAIPAAIAVVATACRIDIIAAGGTYIGTRTLPVYLLHPLILCVLAFLPKLSLTERMAASSLGDAAYPILLTAITILATLVAHSLLGRIPTNPLFKMPAPIVRVLTSSKETTKRPPATKR